MPDDDSEIDFPPLAWQDEPIKAEKRASAAMPLNNGPADIGKCLEIVRAHHPHIAAALDAMWGFSECEAYLSKLVTDAGDTPSSVRVGFKDEVFQAILTLADQHKVTRR